MRGFKRYRYAAKVTTPTMKRIFCQQLIKGESANAFAPSHISVIPRGDPALVGVVCQPATLPFFYFIRVSSLVLFSLFVVGRGVVLVVASPICACAFGVGPISLMFNYAELSKVAVASLFLLCQYLRRLCAVTRRTLGRHLGFILLIVFTACLLDLREMGFSISLRLRQIFVSIASVVCRALNAPTVFAFRSKPVRFGAVLWKRGDGLCCLARPAELFNTESSQGVNPRSRFAFWSGSLAAQTACGPLVFYHGSGVV